MKAIITGPPFIGKTTLVTYLRDTVDMPCTELDEELITINGGTFPQDERHRNTVLVPQVLTLILERDDNVFFTTGFSLEWIKEAKNKGYKIIQLYLKKEALLERDKENEALRVEALHQNLMLQNTLTKSGLVDERIEATGTVEEVAQKMFKALSANDLHKDKKH